MKVKLKYDGPDLVHHSMDVRDLAPALLAFGEMCREANKDLNGDKSTVKVLVNADLKANCLTVSLDVVQSLLEQAKNLLTQENIATAKEILDYLFGGAVAAGGSIGVLQLIKIQSNRSSKNEEQVLLQDSHGNITINIKSEGDHATIIVPPQVAQLAQNKKIVQSAQRLLTPVADNDGIDLAEVTVDDQSSLKIDKDFAKAVARYVTAESNDNEDISYVIGHITIHSPTLDAGSKIWSFRYNDKIEKIDISETTIAKDVLARGKVIVGDTYRVKMEVTEKKVDGKYRNHYKIIEVLDFIPGADQTSMHF